MKNGCLKENSCGDKTITKSNEKAAGYFSSKEKILRKNDSNDNI
jgi:hypothetical protein